jgi:hypothetical protein
MHRTKNVFGYLNNNLTKPIKNSVGGNLRSTYKEMPREDKVRNYAGVAGKTKFSTDQSIEFSTKIKRSLINNHAQLITDFDLIYENPDNIRVYAIGTLHTKPHNYSVEISKVQNYSLENKTQQIRFFTKPKQIKNDIYLLEKSKRYFSDINIKSRIESSQEYKELFGIVLKELSDLNIKVRSITKEDNIESTGLNVLLNCIKTKENNIMALLCFNKKDKE